MSRKTKAQEDVAKVAPIGEQKIWFPTIADLQLPYVPAEHGESVRALLAPALVKMKVRGFPVQHAECWKVSQTLAMLAESDRVQYVEGVWMHCDCCKEVINHGWNVVAGYVFDLSEEFYHWKNPNREFMPERESHTVFTFEQVREYYENYVGEFDPDCWEIISREYWLCDGGIETLPANLKDKAWDWNDEEWGVINALHFRSAGEQLQSRTNGVLSLET